MTTPLRSPRVRRVGGLPLPLAIVFGAIASAAASSLLLNSLGSSDAGTALQTLAGLWLLASLIPFFLIGVRNRDWFHPLAFPLFWFGLVAFAPLAWVQLTGRRVNPFLLTEVEPQVFVIGLIALASFAVGSWLGTRIVVRPERQAKGVVNVRGMREAGAGLVLVLLAVQVLVTIAFPSQPYGFNQTADSLESWFRTTVRVLTLPSVLLFTLGTARTTGRLLDRKGWWMVGGLALATLLAGKRFQVVTIIMVLIWVQHTYVRPISRRALVAATMAVLVLFLAVASVRINRDVLPADNATLVDRSVGDMGMVLGLTGVVMDIVPAQQDYLLGSTYLAAFQYLPPGPIARTIFGSPDNTGTFVFRDLIGYDNPNSGFGFSLVSEAYLNFGRAGVAFVLAGVGLLFGWAWRRSLSENVTTISLLYPVLLAGFPVLLGTDALGQTKMVLYSMALIAIVLRSNTRFRPSNRRAS